MVIIGLLTVKASLFPQRDRGSQVVYVTQEIETPSAGLGCFPMLVFVTVVLLAVAGVF
jgi:hypothetical protein